MNKNAAAQFLHEFLLLEGAMNSEDVRHDVLGDQDNLKTQKSVQKMSKIAIAICIFVTYIHFISLF